MHQHGAAPHVLPLRMNDFVTQFSIRDEHGDHAITLEARALLTMIKRLVRSTRIHGMRVMVMVDSTALLHAVRKGRSSAFHLRGSLRSIAAHVLAGDLQLHAGYVPSRWNAADPPSRGVRSRSQRKPVPRQRSAGTSFERWVHATRKGVRHLVKCGALESSDESWWSSCSDSVCTQPSIDSAW